MATQAIDTQLSPALLQDIELFKNQGVKAKTLFSIEEITKNEAYEFVRRYHYLGDAKFFCAQAFGLFYKPEHRLVGCATYQQPQGTMALYSWFNLPPSCTDIYELGRLCMLPNLNGTNATSFLLGGSIKLLKKQKVIRAVVTLATSDRHVGSIYQVCNFTYYGLTDKKSDFYREEDGKKNPRGPTRHSRGVWVPRPQKHRYAYILDPSLRPNFEPAERPKKSGTMENDCCHGTGIVHDDRFDGFYSCPVCSGAFFKIEEEDQWML